MNDVIGDGGVDVFCETAEVEDLFFVRRNCGKLSEQASLPRKSHYRLARPLHRRPQMDLGLSRSSFGSAMFG